MKCVVVLLIAVHAIICSGLVHTNAYGPVYGYGVPVQSQPIVYTSPTYHGSYRVAPYAYTSPAFSHSYSHTQTHPVAYVRPVTYFNPASSYYAPAYGPAAYTSSAYTAGQYYTPASSNVEQTRFVAPQTNRGFRYQANQQYNAPESRDGAAEQQQFGGGNRGAQKPAQTIHIHITQPNSPYTQSGGQYQDQYNRKNQFNQQNRKGMNANNRNTYADRMPYTNNGEQVKLRRYQVHRPGIQKEFYDVEERVIVRPVGSALIELDTPTKKQDIADYQSNNGRNNFNPNQQRQFNQKGYQPNNNQQSFTADNQNYENQQYFSGQPEYNQIPPVYRVPDCGGFDGGDNDDNQTPVNEYGPPVISGGGSRGGDRQTPQYHPTTFTPTTNRFPSNNYPTNNHPSNGYPTTVIPLTPRPTYYPTYFPTTTGSYPTTTVQGSYPRTIPPQYPTNPVHGIHRTTPGQFSKSTNVGSTKTSTPGQQSDIFISSTTPVSVTIVDKNENSSTKTGSQDPDITYAFDENSPDQVQNELPPRGDISQSEQQDQFYHELPRSRYTNGPIRQPQANNVYSRSRGEPTESSFNSQENADLVEIDERKDTNNNRNRPSSEQQQQGRLIAVTPAPATYQPTETVNHRRIVIAKPVNLVQEVVEPDNSTTNRQRGNYADGRGNQGNNQNYSNQNSRYQNDDFESNDDSTRFNGNGESERYQNGNDNDKFNGNEDFNRNSDHQNDDSEFTQGQYNERNRNENSNFNQNSNYNGKYQNENSDYDRNSDYNGQYRNENGNFNGNFNQKAEYNSRNPNQFANSDVNYARNSNDQQSKNANYEESVSSTTPAGVYISTTPSSASQRIIYVQPVSQDFASQKAVTPKNQ